MYSSCQALIQAGRLKVPSRASLLVQASREDCGESESRPVANFKANKST
jgi:hypothetical protein